MSLSMTVCDALSTVH